MYKNGKEVYVKKGKGLEGPYTVEKRNTDLTYELKKIDTGVTRHRVKEDDIED